MKILVLGGDGYLGWPTAMYLSSKGYDVAVADNYLRRNLARENDVEPLYMVPNLHERTRIWKKAGSGNISVFIGNLQEWDIVAGLFSSFVPDAIVHYAEQPSAPYSMMNRRSASLTLLNNISVTTNIIFAIREYCPHAHLVKLGTMGEYGTPDIDIEEGWLDVNHNGRKHRFLYPRQASSLYHTTKIMDTDLLWFYVRTWGLRVTDLMQGPVYGIFSEESRLDPSLLPFFSYDEIFGTVLNRFVVQAVAGYPLTVYGKGGQTRGYLNIIDTLNCVRLAIEEPAKEGGLRIFNQFTEIFSVNQLADKVRIVGDKVGLNVKIRKLENPRNESEEHYYNPTHSGLLELGLNPTLLTDDVLEEMMQCVLKQVSNVRKDAIFKGQKWD